jgi:signal peptidase I
LESDQDLVKPAKHPDSAVIGVSDEVLADKGIAAKRYILPMGEADPEIQRVYKQPWNQDHFGPVKVPPGKYFLLGDNRHNAMDSRYIGFVDNSSFMGTLIW